MAQARGFEPLQMVLETIVLPITPSPYKMVVGVGLELAKYRIKFYSKLVGVPRFELGKYRFQGPVPYHLATRQNYKWWREVDSNHRTRRNRFTVCRV